MTRREEITNALTSKGALKPCEACGHQKWLVPNDGTPDTALELSMIIGNSLDSAVSFSPAICTNCGNTRLFHLETALGRKR